LRRVKVVWDMLREYADSQPSLFVQGEEQGQPGLK